MRSRAWLALVAPMGVLTVAACGAPLMRLPAGPGVPAAGAAPALDQATAACRGIKTISAEVSVNGKVGGRRVRARLLAGLTSPDSVYLEAPAPFGAPIFILAARGAEITLLLPRERRVLERGRPDEVLEAVTGIPLSPADLRLTLTGCIDAIVADDARSPADGWLRVAGATADVYLRRPRASDPWRIVAVVRRPAGRPAWRAEYRDFSGDVPRTVRLTSADPGRFDLNVSLSQVEMNVPLESDTFRLSVPPGATPITIDEIRDAGPLAASPPNDR